MRIPQRVANGRRIHDSRPLSSGSLQKRETSAERLSSSSTSTASTLTRSSLSSDRSSRRQRPLLVIGIALVALGVCVEVVLAGLFALRLWLNASTTSDSGLLFAKRSFQRIDTELSEFDDQLNLTTDKPLVNTFRMLKTENSMQSITSTSVKIMTSDVIPLIKNLTFSRRINIWKEGRGARNVVGMTGGAAANQLFIAFWSKRVVRSFNTQSEQFENDVHTNPNTELLKDVAYNAYLKTLFIATYNTKAHTYIVRAFKSRNASNWTQTDQIAINLRETIQWIATLRVLPDNTLLFGKWDTNGVHVCPVHQNQTLHVCKRLTLTQKHLGFDVRSIGDEILLVAALTNERVGLYRLETEGFVPLNTVDPFWPFSGSRPINPLFIGSTLLVGMAPSNSSSYINIFFNEVLAYRISGGMQLDNYRHIKLQGAREIFTWCLVNATLFVLDSSVNEIIVYTIQSQ